MISNIVSGGGFKGALKYAHEKNHAEFLHKNGVFNDEPEAISGEMRAVSDQKNIKSPVWHISLSLDDEKATPDQWKRASEAYLKKMGFDIEKTQYTVTRHNDTSHDHIHIVANRVQLNGQVVNDFQFKKRSHEATREAEKAAGLKILTKETQHANSGKLHDLKSHINTSLTQHKNYNDFKVDLKTKGIEIVENRSATTNRLSGLSYKIEGGQVWKGSALGKDYSANGLAKRGLEIENVSQSPINSTSKNHQNDGKKNLFANKMPSNHRKLTSRVDEILGKKRPRLQKNGDENMSDSERRKYQNQNEM